MRLAATSLILFAIANGLLAGCAAPEDRIEAASASNLTEAATASVSFTADFATELHGRVEAGKDLIVTYDPARLPQCRGGLPGGRPAWNITGYYSQNGATPELFEPTALSPDGTDRVAVPVALPVREGGDISLWFQVHSSFGCSSYDSAFGQNYHFGVIGDAPAADATISFGGDGAVERTGTLHAGGKVKVRYAQDRLSECRRVQGGQPQWAITGFSRVNGGPVRTFETGRPASSDRESIDAIIELPHSGELSLWFQVVGVGGCMKYDSNGGANYTFAID